MNTKLTHPESSPSADTPTGSEGGSAPSSPRDNLLGNYLRLFRDFRREDLQAFCSEHRSLYEKAIATGDHLEVTQHYYALMASLIATYYGDGWHFCPPESDGQKRVDAIQGMYRCVSQRLELTSEKSVLDVGCGEGGMLRFMAQHSNAKMTGITLGENEVERGNHLIAEAKLSERCQLAQGDCQAMPFENASFDAAYAVYSLKYYTQLDRVLGEIHRVTRSGGRFTAYCLCRSDSYSEADPTHARLLRDFEYSTAMPRLHTVEEIIAAAEETGFSCIAKEDLSQGRRTWYSYWVRNPLLPWAVSSRLVSGVVRSAERVRLLPRGFTEFYDTFLAGTVRHIIRGGRMGVLTGSALLTFEK